MTETNWIADGQRLEALAAQLADSPWVGLDTEFLRERTFYPRLCLVQVSSPRGLWLVDTLAVRDLTPLLASLTAAGTRKIAHAARQDLETLFLATRQVPVPVFDTQIAAGCAGLKPQIGYAELADMLLGVHIAKGQTRTDWSRRPLSQAQLDYATEDVRHLDAIALALQERLDRLGRTSWVAEDCALLADPDLYETDPNLAWRRLKGLEQMQPRARGIAMTLAAWRERHARERDLPRSWILSDAGLYALSHQAAADEAALLRAAPECEHWRDEARRSLLQAIAGSAIPAEPALRAQDLKPTPAQKELLHQLARVVDERAKALGVSPEILATRGELRALAMNDAGNTASTPASLRGWRRKQIGEELLAVLKNQTRAAPTAAVSAANT